MPNLAICASLFTSLVDTAERTLPFMTASGGLSLEVRDEDVARLWPRGWEHINFLRRYTFALSELVARGELGPLLLPDNMVLV